MSHNNWTFYQYRHRQKHKACLPGFRHLQIIPFRLHWEAQPTHTHQHKHSKTSYLTVLEKPLLTAHSFLIPSNAVYDAHRHGRAFGQPIVIRILNLFVRTNKNQEGALLTQDNSFPHIQAFYTSTSLLHIPAIQVFDE
ncbi:MAG: Uncharacterised protein [SAR116 cluster bacterium]|nr:MAG: Uncharacterised protein [SAR116 cluster bacterium]